MAPTTPTLLHVISHCEAPHSDRHVSVRPGEMHSSGHLDAKMTRFPREHARSMGSRLQLHWKL
jgi:hypothetical protein